MAQSERACLRHAASLTCSARSSGFAKSSSSYGGLRRRWSGPGSGFGGAVGPHQTSGAGQHRQHLMSVAVGRGWRSCGGATGGQGGRVCRSTILSSWRPAQGAKACRRRTCLCCRARVHVSNIPLLHERKGQAHLRPWAVGGCVCVKRECRRWSAWSEACARVRKQGVKRESCAVV